MARLCSLYIRGKLGRACFRFPFEPYGLSKGITTGIGRADDPAGAVPEQSTDC